jgi:hypothetical protein
MHKSIAEALCLHCYLPGKLSHGIPRLQDEWVKRHVMYPGLEETLKACKYPWYIVTSRAKHRTLKLVDAMLDMQWPEDTPRLYCKLLPPNQRKIETLQ